MKSNHEFLAARMSDDDGVTVESAVLVNFNTSRDGVDMVAGIR